MKRFLRANASMESQPSLLGGPGLLLIAPRFAESCKGSVPAGWDAPSLYINPGRDTARAITLHAESGCDGQLAVWGQIQALGILSCAVPLLPQHEGAPAGGWGEG